jgi:hypothetical protein
MKIRTILLLLLTISSCKETDPNEELRKNIKILYDNINMMTIQKGCVTDPGECRILLVGCGSAVAYNVTQVDTVKLFAKNADIRRLSAQHSSAQYPCDIIAPDSTFIRDCNCVLGSKKR